MKLEDVVFDVYQGSIISGIRLKALFSALTDEQKEIYKKTVNDELEKIKGKLNKNLTHQQAKEIINTLTEF